MSFRAIRYVLNILHYIDLDWN